MKSGLCSYEIIAGEKVREICRDKFGARRRASFPEARLEEQHLIRISRHFSWRTPRAVSGEIFTAALPQPLQRRDIPSLPKDDQWRIQVSRRRDFAPREHEFGTEFWDANL